MIWFLNSYITIPNFYNFGKNVIFKQEKLGNLFKRLSKRIVKSLLCHISLLARPPYVKWFFDGLGLLKWLLNSALFTSFKLKLRKLNLFFFFKRNFCLIFNYFLYLCETKWNFFIIILKPDVIFYSCVKSRGWFFTPMRNQMKIFK